MAEITVSIVPTPMEALAELVSQGHHRDPAEVNASLVAAWPLLHAPHRYHEAGVLVALFRHAGFVTDGPDKPATDLTVYRGEPDGSAEAGMAWTTDRATAIGYMRRYAAAGPAVTWQAVASPESVLARFSAEDEVVVQPVLLANVIRIAEFPAFVLGGLAFLPRRRPRCSKPFVRTGPDGPEEPRSCDPGPRPPAIREKQA